MNITELDNYRLSDAVKFHDRLNPRLWDDSEHLRPEVKAKLLEIAADFQEFLGVPDLDVKDITVSGSNAAYNYTSSSDIDLHLIVDLPEADRSEVFRELFDAKKYQYNDMHNIKIGGYDVELYVQDPKQEHHSQGIYSLVNDNWISVPKRRKPEIDDVSVRSKAEDLAARIDDAVKSNDYNRIADLHKKIKAMRQSGLEQQGEYSSDNLAFKVLRNQGYIKKLIDARNAARDAELSLQERKKTKKKVKYGFGGWFFPGYHFNAGETGDAAGDAGGESIREEGSTPDGVSPTTQMFLNEKDNDDTTVLRDFIQYAKKSLGLKKLPKILIHKNPKWSESNKSFGRYEPETKTLHVSLANRHLLDILRTTAHELAHCRQHEIQDLPADAGDTGSKFENQAHAQAGVIMRHWAEQHPEHFEDLRESSGYIPTEKQKNDPRYSMALTVDVHPGQTGKEANKMSLKTDAQGKPALLMKTANLIKEGRSRDLNEPRGPETPPTMPAGTVKVDVSDMYDWYKLGQHISNMKGLGKHDFGAGPPSSIISFGDEDTEHRYIKDLEATGLTTTDIDPRDPKRSKGMKRQKTDPTYNVDEDIVESLRQELSLLEDEYLPEVKMSTANLRQLAAKTGARAGMEFEMIVPDVGGVDLEPEYERDEDRDQRTRSFSDIEEFFFDGDYNGRGDIRRLMEAIDEAYQEWKMDQVSDDWIREGLDYMRDYIENNDLFDREEALDTARDEVIDANPDLPTDSEEFQQLINARINELQEEFVQNEFDAQGNLYNDAFTEFADEKNNDYDEGDFLRDNYPYMSDIEREFDIQWPYYYDINDGQSGEANVDEVADEFSDAIGKPVNASSSYHGARREPGHYVVEPDGSLEGDDVGDTGLEFVSPPLPIDELLSDLNKVKEWAGSRGCYTNDSTGLHINISVPDYSLEKLDYVKLALLMGDEYVLELFGRSGNHYAKAATGKIRDALRKNPDLAPALMDKMRGHMEDLATKAIHSGTTDKYTSINTKTGYIEFRSPGGDWLDANFDKIENTLLRFTVALSAAIDPQAYRKEYLKKLYKMLEGSQEKGGVDVVQLFSNYSAGELDKAALIRQVREKQLARNLAKGKTPPGQKYWWSVTNPANSFASIEVVATSKEEAIEKAIEPGNYPEWARVQNTLRATPLRPYQEPQAPNQTGNWGIWMQGPGRFARAPGQIDNSVLRRFPSREAAEQWIAQTRSTNSALRTDIEVREIEPAATSQPQQGSGAYTYRVFTTDGNQTVGTFQSDGIQGSTNANIAFRNYLTSIGRDSAAGFNYEQIGRERQQPEFVDTTTQSNRGDLTPRGPGPWEIYRISDNSAVRPLSNTSRPEAEQEARSALGLRGEAPELYGVRTRQQAAPQPLGAGQELVGWKIVDAQGRTIHEFSGVGNVQADANNFAVNWLRRNPQHMQAGVEVVPNWRAA